MKLIHGNFDKQIDQMSKFSKKIQENSEIISSTEISQKMPECLKDKPVIKIARKLPILQLETLPPITIKAKSRPRTAPGMTVDIKYKSELKHRCTIPEATAYQSKRGFIEQFNGVVGNPKLFFTTKHYLDAKEGDTIVLQLFEEESEKSIEQRFLYSKKF